MARIARIAVFVDGNFFLHASTRFANSHPIRQRLDLGGLDDYLVQEAAKALGASRYLVAERHFFRGKALGSPAGGSSLDDALLLLGYTVHTLPLHEDPERGYAEKGVDVALAVEAVAGALERRFEALVLVSGDGDFVPLVRKLRSYGVVTVLPTFDLPPSLGGGRETRTARSLLREVYHTVDIGAVAEAALRGEDARAAAVFGIRLGPGPFPEEEGLPMEGRVSRIYANGSGGRVQAESTGEDLFFPAQEVQGGIGALQVGDRVRFFRSPNRHPAAKEPYMAAKVERLE